MKLADEDTAVGQRWVYVGGMRLFRKIGQKLKCSCWRYGDHEYIALGDAFMELLIVHRSDGECLEHVFCPIEPVYPLVVVNYNGIRRVPAPLIIAYWR